MIVLAKGHKAEEENLSWKLVHFFVSGSEKTALIE